MCNEATWIKGVIRTYVLSFVRIKKNLSKNKKKGTWQEGFLASKAQTGLESEGVPKFSTCFASNFLLSVLNHKEILISSMKRCLHLVLNEKWEWCSFKMLSAFSTSQTFQTSALYPSSMYILSRHSIDDPLALGSYLRKLNSLHKWLH